MGLFKELKTNNYVENLKNASKTQLSLINTINLLQNEYEALFAENEKFKAEILKLKGK